MTSPTILMSSLNSALQRGDREGVNRACRHLIDGRAPLAAQWRSIAIVLHANGESTDARRAADLLVEATGNSPLGRFVQAEVYARTGMVDSAAAIMRRLPADVPDPVGNAYFRGTLATNLGAFDEAREQLRRAVSLAPHSGQSWLALATLGKVADDDGHRMLSVRDAMAKAPPAERGQYLYALAKYLDEHGRHDDAFASVAAGAAVEAMARRSDPALEQKAVADAIQGWTRDALDSLPKQLNGAGRAIFVTGLPRSGSTLVEQILSAHSEVDGGEELGLLRHVVGDIGDATFGAVERALVGGCGAALIELYDRLLAERYPGDGRVVDKTLLASRHMGVIASLFPGAPVIWLRRDPLDSAWSIFRTYFREQLAWSFDLRGIAEQMRAEDALFAHWSALLPDRILPVDYAELVRDPDTVVPRIIAHCGLALEPEQLRAHEGKRTVTTASVVQVRQPINTGAIDSAAPYRRHLQPFIDAYGYRD